MLKELGSYKDYCAGNTCFFILQMTGGVRYFRIYWNNLVQRRDHPDSGELPPVKKRNV
jgi:hypothetical protein